ncbi:hypothetical protein KIW84_065621 [Lathyrus oleraceus]|uniref:DUF7745 domain-containing protein n=1 Tax=Pisum sativum TaxID=3888 RepID=A0A9D4WDJ1_PEA|nr:hypothetical protein KIW84_065621 [Pisum sativum]
MPHEELLRKVTHAWEKVHVKENKLKRKDTSSEESYTHWVKERVHLTKLPFMIDPTYVPDILDHILVSIEEVDRLKAIIARLEQDKESLEHILYDATCEKNKISYDLKQKDKQLLENMEELEAERSKRQKKRGLFSVKVNFENINSKLKEDQTEGALAKSQATVARQRQLRIEAEQVLPLNWRRIYQELLNLREQVHLQAQDHKVLTAQVTQLEGEIQYLRDLFATAQVIVQEQGDWAEAWRVECSNLEEFANNLVCDILRMYKRADDVANFY